MASFPCRMSEGSPSPGCACAGHERALRLDLVGQAGTFAGERGQGECTRLLLCRGSRIGGSLCNQPALLP
jgi:hypothetical protein